MNLFDNLVQQALNHQPTLSMLRIVVEKELLHHDILRILAEHQLLKDLTFIGGTALRACYRGVRLSEDLDFTGGKSFSRTQLSTLGDILVDSLFEKYGLNVKVTSPEKDKKNVDTWKIKIETRPESQHLPAQRINIDICAVPSYDPQPMLLINPYGVDMGTQGLVIQTESREEIFADKLLAFALRPNRVKYRDLWDIAWLHQESITPAMTLIPLKLQDRQMTLKKFLSDFTERRKMLMDQATQYKGFQEEMKRFLPTQLYNQIELAPSQYWVFIHSLLTQYEKQLRSL